MQVCLMPSRARHRARYYCIIVFYQLARNYAIPKKTANPRVFMLRSEVHIID